MRKQDAYMTIFATICRSIAHLSFVIGHYGPAVMDQRLTTRCVVMGWKFIDTSSRTDTMNDRYDNLEIRRDEIS